MQDNSSRPFQKGYTIGELSDKEAISLAREAIGDALILYPNTPAIQLAEILIKESDQQASDVLAQSLLRSFYVMGILSTRCSESAANRRQALLPGFEHLPLKIPSMGGRRISLLAANREAVRAYYWSLMKAHTDRKRRDPRIIEAKTLLDRMNRYTRTNKAITVRQVLLLEQEY